MTIPPEPSYDHGSTGTEPSSPIDYANGDALSANNLDYYLYTEFDTLSKIIQYLNTVDSDGDGVVDKADTATTATNVKGNDIDSDGDGVVDKADLATDSNALEGNTTSDIRPSVSDNGTSVLNAITDINFNSNLTASDDGDGTVTVDASGGGSGYSDSDAIDAINTDSDHGSTASHNYYSDSDARSAINTDSDHGSTASHNYFSGSHNDLSSVGSNDHHTAHEHPGDRSASSDLDMNQNQIDECAGLNFDNDNSRLSWFTGSIDSAGGISFYFDGTRKAQIDDDFGNLDITGSLTENASL